MIIDPWLSVDQVGLVCQSCAESMKNKGIKAIRASVLRNAQITWQECVDKAIKKNMAKDAGALCGWLKSRDQSV